MLDDTNRWQKVINRHTVQLRVATAVVVTLAALGYWQWAWLILALVAIDEITDNFIGLVITLTAISIGIAHKSG